MFLDTLRYIHYRVPALWQVKVVLVRTIRY